MYLQDFHNSAPLESQNFRKFRQKFRDFEKKKSQNFDKIENFSKKFKIFFKFQQNYEKFDGILRFERRRIVKIL